jgi:LemA protein
MGPVLILVIVLIAIAAIGALLYNGLVTKRNQIDEALGQIEVQLKRRHDLIPNLVDAVKGYMNFEKSVLENVTAARANAVAAGSQGPAQQAQAENALTGALRSLFAVVENYPELKANQNVLQLQEELTSTENKISFARQLYNDTATEYNTKQMQFPTNLVAGLAKASPAELWEIEDAAERAVPAVDLSLDKPPAA